MGGGGAPAGDPRPSESRAAPGAAHRRPLDSPGARDAQQQPPHHPAAHAVAAHARPPRASGRSPSEAAEAAEASRPRPRPPARPPPPPPLPQNKRSLSPAAAARLLRPARPRLVSPPPASLTPRSPPARSARRVLHDLSRSAASLNSPSPSVLPLPSARPSRTPSRTLALSAASPALSSPIPLALSRPLCNKENPPAHQLLAPPNNLLKSPADHPKLDHKQSPHQPALSQEERIAMWRCRFSTYTIYLSGFDHALTQKIASQIRALGANISSFLSAKVTHFVSAVPIDPHPSSPSSSRASASRDPSRSLGLRSSAKDSAVIARRLNCKIWPYAKLEKIIRTLMPTQPRADLEGRLEQERISKASGRSSTGSLKLVFRPFEGSYLLVQDVSGSHCPIFGEQFEQSPDSKFPPWPVIHFKTHSSKAVFAPQSTAAIENDDDPQCTKKENERAASTHPDDQNQHVAVGAATATATATVTADTSMTTSLKAPTTPRPKSGQMNKSPRFGRNAETHAAHPHGGVDNGAGSTTIQTGTASASSARAQPLSIASGLVSNSTLRRILRRDPLDDPRIAKMDQRAFAPAAGQLGGLLTPIGDTPQSRSRQIQQPSPTQTHRDTFDPQHTPRLQPRKLNLDRTPKLALDRSKCRKSKPRHQHATRHHRIRIYGMQFYTRPGYCENCCITYDNYCDHVSSDKHLAWASNTQNFVGIDAMIETTRRNELGDVVDPYEMYEICRRDEPVLVNDGSDFVYDQDYSGVTQTGQTATQTDGNNNDDGGGGRDRADGNDGNDAHGRGGCQDPNVNGRGDTRVQGKQAEFDSSDRQGSLTTGTLVLVQTRITDTASLATTTTAPDHGVPALSESRDGIVDAVHVSREVGAAFVSTDIMVDGARPAPDATDITVVGMRPRASPASVSNVVKPNSDCVDVQSTSAKSADQHAIGNPHNDFLVADSVLAPNSESLREPESLSQKTTPKQRLNASQPHISITTVSQTPESTRAILSPIQRGGGRESFKRRLYFEHSYTSSSIRPIWQRIALKNASGGSITPTRSRETPSKPPPPVA